MPKKELKGIQGWLLVYVIFLFFRLLLNIFIFITLFDLRLLVAIEVILIGIALTSIFMKSSYTKIINIGYWVVSVLLTIIANLDVISSGVIDDRAYGAGAVIGSIAMSTVWILYFVYSKRVKDTFKTKPKRSKK